MRDGQPPTPVYLDAKHGYDLFGEPGVPFLRRRQLEEFRAEVKRQANAIPEGSVLEWHFSDPDAAARVEEFFEDQGINNVVVYHTPVSGAGGTK